MFPLIIIDLNLRVVYGFHLLGIMLLKAIIRRALKQKEKFSHTDVK